MSSAVFLYIWEALLRVFTIKFDLKITETDHDEDESSKELAESDSFSNDNDTDQIPAPRAASIQFMITYRMRRILEEELNYLPKEVDVMDPQIAQVVIERGLSRPLTGMPVKWGKDQSLAVEHNGQLKSMIKKATDLVFMKIFPLVIPVAAIIYALPMTLRYFRKKDSTKSDSVHAFKRPGFVLKGSQKSSKNLPRSSPPSLRRDKKHVGAKGRKDVDMRALNRIVKPFNLLSSLTGK